MATADESLRLLGGDEKPENPVLVALVGFPAQLNRLLGEDVEKLRQLLDVSETEKQLLQAAACVVGQPKYTSASRDVLLLRVDPNASLRRVVLVVLPSARSRHNSPCRPDGILSALRSLASATDDVHVHCVAEQPEHVFAMGCAVARAFPAWHGRDAVAEKLRGRRISVSFSEELSASAASTLLETMRAIRFSAMLVDMPCNILNTTEMVRFAGSVVDSLKKSLAHRGEDPAKVALEVIEGDELQRRGFGGIFGVGKAATHPPALAILSYFPPGTTSGDAATILVGKGIVYDTGGLSIKTKTGMPGMKKDMGGASGILGAFRAAVAAGVPQKPLYCLLCLAENAVGPLATRPDDIHTFYSGLTVEINNTDAEGRLVLADGVAFAAKHLNPHIVINMCTLTGAQGIATGQKHAAIYCNDEDVEEQTLRAGRSSGDLAHAVPYCPEFYRGEFASKVADMKNSVADRSNAQVSCAAQFIGNHLREYQETGRWLHIDMAYPVAQNQRATGYGVALLVELIRTSGW